MTGISRWVVDSPHRIRHNSVEDAASAVDSIFSDAKLRILVYPHDLTIGGSQINAIDLAAGVKAAGHDVIVFGVPGPLTSYIQDRNLRFIPAHPLRYRPAPSRVAQIATIVRKEKIDLVHSYEWSACLDAYFGAHLLFNMPLLCTVLSMDVSRLVPPSIPLIMGTAELEARARLVQRERVWTLEPPIDIERDHPQIDGTGFRKLHGVADSDLLVVSVSRLALDLKIDALVRAIDAADQLADQLPLRLILVGGGPASDVLNERAASVNLRHGRPVVTLVGPDLDPRAAYAAADLVIGMGSSALRAMAIGRPVIVQGEDAFSLIFEPANLEVFMWQGFHGKADAETGPKRLVDQMKSLLSDPALRKQLGRYGRTIVTERFSLERAVHLQMEIYRETLADKGRRHLLDATKAAARAIGVEVENHTPSVKRRREATERNIYGLVRAGNWPPRSTL